MYAEFGEEKNGTRTNTLRGRHSAVGLSILRIRHRLSSLSVLTAWIQ